MVGGVLRLDIERDGVGGPLVPRRRGIAGDGLEGMVASLWPARPDERPGTPRVDFLAVHEDPDVRQAALVPGDDRDGGPAVLADDDLADLYRRPEPVAAGGRPVDNGDLAADLERICLAGGRD